MKKILFHLISLVIFATSICFGAETMVITNPGDVGMDMRYVSWIYIPGITDYEVLSLNSLGITVKYIFGRIIEYLPMLVLVLLLFACLKMIFEGDGKSGFKRIKYILIGVAIMILSIYIMNVVSTIISGYPIINIHFNRWY